ncbi:hypothetical protein BD311DRAFT_805009 [Dichomitus squalens]|uniref:DUF8212 domain-containing protein n=1 Tax=Dichomitus squalens TaxID=114155 RepID=A0A4Q9MUS0_9APHY|nr:hypothetical protein BD311DRAFT_805009 [Dichomitus squalens]
MDIVGVKIPVAYGEGRYALIRLQEEILKANSDQTLYTWGPCYDPISATRLGGSSSSSPHADAPTSAQFMLASSLHEFAGSSALDRITPDELAELEIPVANEAFELTQYGVHARLPLSPLPHRNSYPDSPTHLALLGCKHPDKGFLALLLRPYKEHGGEPEFLVGTRHLSARLLEATEEFPSTVDEADPEPLAQYTRTVFLSASEVAERSSGWTMTDVYIPHYPSRTIIDLEYNASLYSALRQAPGPFEVRLSDWNQKLLSMLGFSVAQNDSNSVVTLSRNGGLGSIRIHVSRCKCERGCALGLLTVRVSSDGADSPRPSDLPVRDHNDEHVESWHFFHGVASRVEEGSKTQEAEGS